MTLPLSVSTASKSGAVATGFRQHDNGIMTPAMMAAILEEIDRLPRKIEAVFKLLEKRSKNLEITKRNMRRRVEF